MIEYIFVNWKSVLGHDCYDDYLCLTLIVFAVLLCVLSRSHMFMRQSQSSRQVVT